MAGSHPRARVADAISEMIIAQQLPAGRSVGEVALAQELGVSRTPVREALLGLEGSGLVRSRRGQGFVVLPLDRREAEQVYPIIASLERLAVEQSGPPSATLLDGLHEANANFALANGARERVKMDAAWHRLIVSGCGNDRLVRLIDSQKQTILRYEYAYLNSVVLRDHSIAEHDQIIALFERSPMQAAMELEQHWLRGMQQTLQMFCEGEE